MATSKSTSCQANCRPIHPLTPFPKGFQLSGGRFLNPPLSILSGLNVSLNYIASGKDIPVFMSIISPDLGIGMKSIQHDHDMMILWYQVLSTNNLIFVFRCETNSRCGRLEPQRLLERCIEVLEFLQLFEFDRGRTADIVDFIFDCLIRSGSLEEEVE